MKKLLILLLIVGCDYAPTEHTHDDEINQIIGIWNLVSSDHYYPSVDVEGYWILDDTLSYNIGEQNSLSEVDYTHYYSSMDYKDNGVLIWSVCSNTTQKDTTFFEGIWLTNGNKLHIIFDESNNNGIVSSDFEIKNKHLITTTISYENFVEYQKTIRRWIKQ